jgi:hypothetical protein
MNLKVTTTTVGDGGEGQRRQSTKTDGPLSKIMSNGFVYVAVTQRSNDSTAELDLLLPAPPVQTEIGTPESVGSQPSPLPAICVWSGLGVEGY